MNEIFLKITSGFIFDWDLSEMMKADILVDPNGAKNKYHSPYNDPSQRLHWQQYPTGILFLRNFFINYSLYADDFVRKLLGLQNLMRTTHAYGDNYLIREFLNHKPARNKVILIKIPAGVSVSPHCDTTRDICINVGLKNSNTCMTHISESSILSEYHTSVRHSFCMEDGDVYVISIKNAHSVESLVLPGPGDFDYGKMRFLNRNLNYFYFESMVSQALKNNYTFNPNYKNALKFCEGIRPTINQTGPFGRMCLWKMGPQCYLVPHRDNWEYHRHINRYILCISDHKDADATIKIGGKTITVEQGLLFSFMPDIEIHEFVNHTDRDWFFMGFDFWHPEKLSSATQKTGISKDYEIAYVAGFGGYSKKAKFMSQE